MARRHLLRGWLVALGCVCACGCTMMSWDDLSSRDFKMAQLWTPPPPPLAVIEKSTDGYARAKAINKLDEPSNPADLDVNIRVLQRTALSDRDPLCRIAALRTLARYKDPRAAKILVEVFDSNPGLSAENNAFVKQQALASLQVSAPAEARQLFIQTAKQPAGGLTLQAQRDRLEILDERLTAIRALGKYPQQDAVETLVKLLETEKDIAIRKCAQEALVSSTKKDFPADGKIWREYVSSGKEPPPQSMFAKLTKSAPAPTTPQSDSPGVFNTIANWVRPERQPDANPVSMPKEQPRVLPGPTTTTASPASGPQAAPSTLPATLPAMPAPTPTPSQPRRDVAPVVSPALAPAGAVMPGANKTYNNIHGEPVVPYSQ